MQSRILTKHNQHRQTIEEHGAENRLRKTLIRSGRSSIRTCYIWEHGHGYGPYGIPAVNADDSVARHRGKNSDCVMEKEIDSPPYFKGRPGSEGEKTQSESMTDILSAAGLSVAYSSRIMVVSNAMGFFANIVLNQ